MDRSSQASAGQGPGHRLRRRAWVALAIALLGASGSIGILGLASAQQPAPVTYAFAAPRIGDQGAYVPEVSGPDLDPSGDTFLGYTFSVGEPYGLLLPDGQRRLAVPWQEVMHSREVSGRNESWTFGVELDAASGEPLAYSAQQWGSMGGLVNAPGILESTVRQRPVLTTYGPAWGICGHRMHPVGPAKAGAIHVSGRCLPDGRTGTWQPANFTSLGIEPMAGGKALHLMAQRGHNRTDLWIDGATPYPVRIQHRTGMGGTESVWTLALASFQPGSAPLPPSSHLPGIEPAPIELAKREVYGPSEQGVDVAFPLSAAWRSANTLDANLARYMARHPDALVAAAQFREQSKDGQAQRTWTFVVATPNVTEALQVEVTRRDMAGLGSALAATGQWADITQSEGLTLAPAQAAALWVPQMPTVASMFARWPQHAGPDEAALAPNSWGFSLLCPADGDLHCPLRGPWYSAGRWLFEAGFLPESMETNDTGTELGFDGQGHVAFVQHWRQRTTADVGPAAPSGSANAPPTPPSAQGRPAPTFAWPSAAVSATAGGASLFAALLYWLWPTLKGGVLGLFSRVREEAVLAHPVRKEIATFIAGQPGIHLLGLVRATGHSVGSVRHHLGLLMDRGIVVRHRGPHYDCYFMAGTGRHQVASARALKSPSARRVLEAVARQPGRNGRSVALETGLDPSTVSECARVLREAGLVEMQRRGRDLFLYAAPRASEALDSAG